jgi:hypothetical protein
LIFAHRFRQDMTCPFQHVARPPFAGTTRNQRENGKPRPMTAQTGQLPVSTNLIRFRLFWVTC